MPGYLSPGGALTWASFAVNEAAVEVGPSAARRPGRIEPGLQPREEGQAMEGAKRATTAGYVGT